MCERKYHEFKISSKNYFSNIFPDSIDFFAIKKIAIFMIYDLRIAVALYIDNKNFM